MDQPKETLIKILAKSIEIEHLHTDLEHAGVMITRIEDLAYDLLDIALDQLGFLPAGTPFDWHGEVKHTERDWLHSYFFDVYRKKKANELYEALIKIKIESDRQGDQFDIKDYI